MLALLMADYFQDAVIDHPTVAIGPLYTRFFGWLRPAAPRPAGSPVTPPRPPGPPVTPPPQTSG
jgi:hypothetical protein